MRLRNTLILVVIFISLGVYVYFVELEKTGTEKSEKLLQFKEDDVESIVFNYPEQEIRLSKETSGKWKITSPLQTGADESTISHLLTTLNSSEVKRTVEEKPSTEDLKNFGLDNPKIKVSITLKKNNPPLSLAVGGKTPVGNSAYVRGGIEPGVLLTNASLASTLVKKLYDFRDKKIIEFNRDAAKRFVLKGAKGEFVLLKKDKDWFIEKPKPYRADQAEVQGILSTIHNMSAQDFPEESSSDLRKYGLEKPRLRVTLFSGEDNEQREILFGHKKEGKDEVYLIVDSKGTVYTVYESVFKELNKDLAALGDKEILSFSQDQVTKLRISTPKESWVLTKGEKEEWKVEAPKQGKTRQGIATNYLSTLGSLRAKGFVEDDPKNLKKYGLDFPSVKISLDGKDGENLGTLLLASKIAGDYYAKKEGNPTVYTIEAFSYNRLDKQLTDFLQEEK